MICTALALALLAKEPAPAPVLLGGGGGDHGKIAWFEGTFEAALAEAKASKKLVFIDFWTSWCGWCKRLDRDTFSDASVAELMKDWVCLSVDAESQFGRPIAERFPVKGYPALLILLADGSLEDKIGGYLPPDKFKKEIQRVRAGKDTVSEFRKQVEADKTNPDKRYRLAQKLERLGDQAGRDAQMAEVKKLDPDGKSLPMRRLAFDAVIAKINAGFQRDRSLDLSAMESFLAKETLPEILFMGHYALGQMHEYLAREATGRGDEAAAKQHGVRRRAALKAGWPNVPEDQAAAFGNTLAWAFYEAREELSAEDKAFALEVAEKASSLAKDDAHTIDTYACCLFMNGKKEEALRQLARCRELDPKNPEWNDRLAEFQK